MNSEAVTARVADDMERIFAPLAGRAAAPQPATEPSRKRPVAWLIAAGALALAAAAAIGIDLGTVPPVKTPERPLAAARAPAPVREGPAPTAQLAVAEPPLTTSSAAAAAPVASSPDAPADSVEGVRDAPRATAAATASSRPADVRAPGRAVPGRPALPADDGCTPDSPENRCIYRDVMAADARLRRAYDRAADAGVSSSWLAAVNRRWERARDRVEDEPDRAIERYDQLAEALDAERREVGR